MGTVRTLSLNLEKDTKVLLQSPDGSVVEQEVPEEVSNVVKTTEWGEVRRGTFSIKVTDKQKDAEGKEVTKVLYENEAEPFEYDFVIGFSNVLVHAGAKLSEDQKDFLGTALKSEDAEADKSIGKAIDSVVKTWNAKCKSDAKSSAYQALVNKHKPLEGEKKEVAQAKLVLMFIKIGGVSAETAIDELKSVKKLPEDYTIADFNSTKLRKSKGDDEDE